MDLYSAAVLKLVNIMILFLGTLKTRGRDLRTDLNFDNLPAVCAGSGCSLLGFLDFGAASLGCARFRILCLDTSLSGPNVLEGV